jgi:hypothetical protein
MENRKQFKFYRSYWDIAKEITNAEDRAAYLMAVCEYQFTGVLPELSGMAKFALLSQKHSLDKQVEGFIFATETPKKEEDPQGIPPMHTPEGYPQGTPPQQPPTAINNNKETIHNTKDSIVENPKSDFDYNLKRCLDAINAAFGKNYRVINDNVKKKYKSLVKQYEWRDVVNAIKGVKADSFHIEKKYKYATPEFFSRPTTVDKYGFTSEAKPEYQGEDAKLVNYVANYYKS